MKISEKWLRGWIDPPYGTKAGEVAIDKLARLGWIGEGTWVSLETGADEEPRVKGMTVEADRKVGKARLTLMRMAATGAPPPE